MTIYYGSQAGGGTGLSFGSPFKISSFFAVAVAGDHLFLLDGTYTGANSMITPTSGLSGISGNPITISAINDGAALINGQSARAPIFFTNNDWWVIEGVNAENADSANNVVDLDSSSSNNIIRRVCAWNAGDTHAVFNDEGTNNLLEDVAGFGQGRKIYSNSQGSNNTIYRRAFGMFNYSAATNGPKEVFSNSYNSHGAIYENCIATWDADGSHPAHSDEYGLFIFERMNDIYPDICASGKYLGCIGYVLSTQTASIDEGALQGGLALDCITFKDCAVYLSNSARTASLTSLAGIYGGPSSGNHVMQNITEIRVAGASSLVESDWTQINRVTGISPDAVYGSESIYVNNGSKGATIRFRYVDGTLTSDELWPWPMNQRIKDAMSLAGRSPHDVNANIQSIFGTFPSGDISADARTTYYVSKTGSDSNSGASPAQAKLTIAAAITLLSPGDKLLIGPGVYTEFLRDIIPAGSSFSLPTIIQASTPDTVTLRPTGGTDVIRLNADNIAIDGIDADAVNCSGSPYEMGNSGNGVTSVIIRNGIARRGTGVTVDGTSNEFYNMRVYGNSSPLEVQGGSGNLCSNNSVYGNAGAYGIHILGGSGNRVQNNIVYGNANDTIQDNGTGSTIDHNLQTNPNWVDPANGDFRLQTGSAAIDTGLALTQYYTSDALGNARIP